MAKYLISFPSEAMVIPDGEWEAVTRDSHAVIEAAKAAVRPGFVIEKKGRPAWGGLTIDPGMVWG